MDTSIATEAIPRKPFEFPKPTLTQEEFAERIAHIRRRRQEEPDFVARLEEKYAESVEYRRQIDEEARRYLDQAQEK